MNWMAIIGWILGGGATLVTAIFYLRYIAVKSNIEGKDETIRTLERSNAAFQEDNERLTAREIELTAQNKAFKDIATQTPAIVELTKAVTELTGTMNTQAKVQAKQAQTTNNQLKAMLKLLAKEKKDAQS